MCKSNLLFNLGGDFYDQVRSQEELNRKNTLLGSIYELQVGIIYNCNQINKTFWFNLLWLHIL